MEIHSTLMTSGGKERARTLTGSEGPVEGLDGPQGPQRFYCD